MKNSYNLIKLAKIVYLMDAVSASQATFLKTKPVNCVRNNSIYVKVVQIRNAKYAKQATSSEIISVVATS